MARISCNCLRVGTPAPNFSSSFNSVRIHVTHCSSNPTPSKESNHPATPQILKFAVTGVTELIRLLSLSNSKDRPETNVGCEDDEIVISGVDVVLDFLKADYERAYFLTGIFTSALYADDCLFEDPTIMFRGESSF